MVREGPERTLNHSHSIINRAANQLNSLCFLMGSMANAVTNYVKMVE